jgi:hypothetical protein
MDTAMDTPTNAGDLPWTPTQRDREEMRAIMRMVLEMKVQLAAVQLVLHDAAPPHAQHHNIPERGDCIHTMVQTSRDLEAFAASET